MRVATLSLLATGLTVTGWALAASAVPAAAYDYPYCLQGRQTGIPGECSYQSYAQCQASASGRSAFCNVNPRVAFQNQRQQGRGYGQRYRDGYPGQFERY